MITSAPYYENSWIHHWQKKKKAETFTSYTIQQEGEEVRVIHTRTKHNFSFSLSLSLPSPFSPSFPNHLLDSFP
ncbi:hypothetical protein L2E82_47737 [Cichorium intybus]|uniref:Uncharacterized protein n=1 Tax=Cichorium intybus TaxID=13427 RepID=A0ACB8Z0I3_CICIN|nr:hypothetical protein L2E82_47737 [Cichorium intybus]